MFSIRIVFQQVVSQFLPVNFAYRVRYFHSAVNSKLYQIRHSSNVCMNALKKNCGLSAETLKHINISQNTLEEYFGEHVINESIVKDNMWIFKLPSDDINKKMKLLSEMHFKSMDHSIPFLKVSEKRLSSLSHQVREEASTVPDSNRLYYFSTQLKVDPYIMAGYISNRVFLFKIPFNNLQRSLETMLELGVKPINILNDLWSLKYSEKIIRERLIGINELPNTKVMPWMIRCQQKVLQRSVHLKSTTKEILGDELSPDTYLAKRLNTTPETIQTMSTITRSIKTTRVSKLKEVVDYLLENGFTAQDIIEVPKILAHSLETIRTRKKILDSMGIETKNLSLFCRSRRDFKHYCELFLKKSIPYSKSSLHGKETLSSKRSKKKSLS